MTWFLFSQCGGLFFSGSILWLLLLLHHSTSAAALNPIQVQGYKFFDSVTGEEFIVKGVDYYPRPNVGDLDANSLDLFSNQYAHIWQRDIPKLKQLGVNAVRLYAVNATQNHDAFMCALEAAGIYAIIALAQDCPTCAITRDAAPDCYPPQLKQQGQLVYSEFAKYSNTLAFSVGNEVNHFAPASQPEHNAPCQKKFLQDMRTFAASCSNNGNVRRVPIGLVSADSDREVVAQYYNCQSSSSGGGGNSNDDDDDDNDNLQAAEWYGLNSYVSCNGNATEYSQAKGLQLLQQSFQKMHYSIPVLLTEFGCLSDSFPTINGYPGQRNFLQAHWLLTEYELRQQFSGGFAFEYSLERANAQIPYPFTQFGKQNYGIGYFSPERCDDVNIPCEYVPFPAYYNLQKAYGGSNGTATTTTTTTTNDTWSSSGGESVVNVHINDFVVPSHRQGRSKCPEQFPPLDSFDWHDVDHTPNLKCPHQRRPFTCPASFAATPAGAQTTHWMLVAIVVMATALLVRSWRRRQQQSRGRRRDADGDSLSSDESVGLLSLKALYNQSGSDGVGNYQAIDSDASSASSSRTAGDEDVGNDLERVVVE